MKKEPVPLGHVRIYVHTGSLSFDNGCVSPLYQYTDLAKLAGVDGIREYGEHYYDDSFVVAEKDLPTVIDILTEQKFLYKIKGEHDVWQNVLTSKVRKSLGIAG